MAFGDGKLRMLIYIYIEKALILAPRQIRPPPGIFLYLSVKVACGDEKLRILFDIYIEKRLF